MKNKPMNAAWSLIMAAAFGQFQHAIGRGARRGKTSRSRRGYTTPHIGKKEQERAKRCRMTDTHGFAGHPRSAPTMYQISKRVAAYFDAL